MSKRRKIGEVVHKKQQGGFLKVALQIKLVDKGGSCMLECGDPECVEWDNAEIVNSEHEGFVYHVSECEMEDI